MCRGTWKCVCCKQEYRNWCGNTDAYVVNVGKVCKACERENLQHQFQYETGDNIIGYFVSMGLFNKECIYEYLICSSDETLSEVLNPIIQFYQKWYDNQQLHTFKATDEEFKKYHDFYDSYNCNHMKNMTTVHERLLKSELQYYNL